MITLTLYSTVGCHLCEAAEALLVTCRAGGAAIEWETVDIADDEALFQRYGWVIPVLRRHDGRELGWPFDDAALRAFLAGEAGG